jgi:F420H(2)-dependent quinone reductase
VPTGFALTNRLVNPVLRRLLRSRLGRRPGRRLAVVRYRGRRTGRPRELVTQYARDGATVWVLVGAADRTTWWRNLRSPAGVDLWLAGERVRARAVAIEGAQQPAAASAGLGAYLAAVPRAASAVGVLRGAGPAALAQAARRAVLVRADVVDAPRGPAA